MAAKKKTKKAASRVSKPSKPRARKANATRKPSTGATSNDDIELDKLPQLSPAAIQAALQGAVGLEAATLKGIGTHVLTLPSAQDVPGSPPEPVYDPKAQDDIQGNTIPGFNKDHQHFLFYSFGKRKDYRKTKLFLRWLVPYLSSMEEVMAFRRLYRARRHRVGKEHTFLCSSWVNIAFSCVGIEKLAGKDDAQAFGDEAFRRGLAARSSYLGDPTSSRAQGHPSRWVVGGSKNTADAVIIVAADSASMLNDAVTLIETRASDAGLKKLFEQRGQTLPGALRGHEHFGFRDGISQPGVRGKLSTAPGDYITPRYIDPADDRRLYFAKPGQSLVWPGQFLLGEPRQSTEHLYNSVSAGSNFPSWAARGSYLVVRRLDQDVPAFWTLVAHAARRVSMSPAKFASMLVGRWPSGAPISRAPTADSPALGGDEFANNHFLFDDDTRPSQLQPIPGYGGDGFPQASADFLATVCPHFAHIRKVNPRESVTDLGKPEDNFARFILRRGIPYGPPLIGKGEGKGRTKLASRLWKQERGLMFLCYGSSIEDQFEFLQRRWANSPSQPNTGGHDPIIGQNGENAGRVRELEFPLPGGGSKRIRFKREWVTPTGGGYFFSPTISAVRDVLGA